LCWEVVPGPFLVEGEGGGGGRTLGCTAPPNPGRDKGGLLEGGRGGTLLGLVGGIWGPPDTGEGEGDIEGEEFRLEEEEERLLLPNLLGGVGPLPPSALPPPSSIGFL